MWWLAFESCLRVADIGDLAYCNGERSSQDLLFAIMLLCHYGKSTTLRKWSLVSLQTRPEAADLLKHPFMARACEADGFKPIITAARAASQ